MKVPSLSFCLNISMIKSFLTFIDEDFNSVYDFIAEGIADGSPSKIKQPWSDYEHDDLIEFGKHYNKNIKPYAVLSQDWLNDSGKMPLGLAADDLENLMTEIKKV